MGGITGEGVAVMGEGEGCLLCRVCWGGPERVLGPGIACSGCRAGGSLLSRRGSSESSSSCLGTRGALQVSWLSALSSLDIPFSLGAGLEGLGGVSDSGEEGVSPCALGVSGITSSSAGGLVSEGVLGFGDSELPLSFD